MKKIFYFSLACVLGLHLQVNGQGNGEVERILKAGTEDLNTYMNSYMEPAAKGFASSMGSGWIQTAATHKTLGFHIKASVSAAAVPSHYETFFLIPSDYNNLRVKEANGIASLPTFFGPPETNTSLEVYEQGFVIANVEALPGAGLPFNYAPVPSIQGGLGLPLGTEIMARFIPKTMVEDTQISQLGFGLKHDFKQYFPVVKDLPFSFSGLVAYNSIQANYFLDKEAGQTGDVRVSGWTFQALASKKFSLLTLYGTLGYSAGKSDFGLLGTYEIPGFQKPKTITDPVSLSYEVSNYLASLGAQLKVGPVFIHGDYTFQEFNTLTVGLGISID